MLAMQWADVNLDRAEWRIKETKNGAPADCDLVSRGSRTFMESKTGRISKIVFTGAGKSGHLEEPKKVGNVSYRGQALQI